MTTAKDEEIEQKRGSFSSRRVFIFAAIGSAVGLGNIWRFPYVAYENGGGAFVIPYLVALLTAGIPFLLLDYSLGHKFRGSAPLSFARLRPGAEGLGWWQVGICFMVAVYYAAVLAWALRYTFFSIDKSWGDDPEGFFFGEFLQAGDPGVDFNVVAGVLIPLLLVWAAIIVVLILGVQKGIGATSIVFIPVLILAFGALVVRSLFLPGAAEGLNALFTPDWAALTDASVWAAAYGQIFFSLSIGFGIMITYSSYVHRHTDMPSSGMVVGFANSSFELLAGIGVFAALGFMAQASGVAVGDVATDGVGLAFIAFPAIISEAPAGALIGVLFFGSLVIAGFTSLISVIEVVISAVRDKFDMSRTGATVAVSLPMAIVSLVFLSTTSGLYVLDIIDHFINQFGILLVAVVSMIVIAWGLRALPMLGSHLSDGSVIDVGMWWRVLVSVVAPLGLLLVLGLAFWTDVKEPYGGYPGWLLAVFGWGVAGIVIVFGALAARAPWRDPNALLDPSLTSDSNQEKGQQS
ncbi:NSS family neurotransmitter:Na+ symporter [Nocardioides albertanoniae]|uniref:Transporter n=1 Tax=Nocardioides albertanoniae TaxID=1175486 RepID=A0A543A2Q6_9ACTN|nr:sodium-dependent transporter [Nocardioides albertanoniae]TQL66863.1 NSS family neurotransmitter:Na+ symporter [Nocardioides albertanoniae]